jgi:hypothetical protein
MLVQYRPISSFVSDKRSKISSEYVDCYLILSNHKILILSLLARSQEYAIAVIIGRINFSGEHYCKDCGLRQMN